MRKRKEVRILTAVDANVIGHVLLRQPGRVGGDSDLTKGDVARFKLAEVLLLVEGLDRLEPLGVVFSLERFEAVDTLALELIDAHTGDALAGLIKSSDDVAHGGALCRRRHVWGLHLSQLLGKEIGDDELTLVVHQD